MSDSRHGKEFRDLAPTEFGVAPSEPVFANRSPDSNSDVEPSTTAEHDSLLSRLSPAEQQEVTEILDRYLQQIEKGIPTDSDFYLKQHPKYETILRRYFESLGVLHLASRGIDNTEAQLSLPEALAQERQLGDYELRRQIGRGGMGIVYEARQISLNRRVALKVLPLAAVLDKRQIARFHREAQAAAQLHHPHIVPVFGVGCEQGVHFYSMQLVNGQSLDRVIGSLRSGDTSRLLCETTTENRYPTRERGEANSPQSFLAHESGCDSTSAFDTVDMQADPTDGASVSISTMSISEGATVCDRVYIDRVAELGIQAASALQHAHDFGIVHRDVKPSNLMLDQDGQLWVTDFGLAHIQSDTEMTATGDLVGTLRYMSPEQARGGCVIDQRSDVYSLGITLYELLTLQRAIPTADRAKLLRDIETLEPKPARRINPAIPKDLETIVLKAISKDRDQRYTRAQEFADDLQRYLDGKPTLARRPTLIDRTTKWAYRHRGLVATLFLALVVTLIGSSVALLSILYGNQQQARRVVVTTSSIHATERIAALAEKLDKQPGIQREILLEARGLYQRFVEANEGKRPFLELAARYDEIANLSRKLGDYDEAAKNFRLAAAAYAELARQQPRLRRLEAVSWNNLGQALIRGGDISQAREAYEEALHIFESLSEATTSRTEIDRGIALVSGNLGHLASKSGDRRQAIRFLNDSILIREQLLASESDNTENRIRLASNYHNLGSQMVELDLGEAESLCRKAIRLQQQVVREQPTEIEPRSDLALSWNNLGSILLRKKDFSSAADFFAQAAELGRILVDEAPKLPQLRHDLAISFNNLGKCLATAGDLDAALKAYESAGREFEALVPQFESDATTMARYGGVLYNQAVVHAKLQSDDLTTIGALFERAVQVQRDSVELAPDAEPFRRLLELSLLQYGEWLESVGDLERVDKVREELARRRAVLNTGEVRND